MSAIDEAARYLTGADENGSAAAFEERLFLEAELAQAASWLLEVRAALRELAAKGPLVPVITVADLASLGAKRRVLERKPVGTVIDVALGPETEFVAVRLPVELKHVPSIDVEFCTPDGTPYFRVHEAPFDPAAGEVVILCQRHVALAAADVRLVVRSPDGATHGEFSLLARQEAAL